VNGQKKEGIKEIVADIRQKAVQYGRGADDVNVFMGASLVLGRTDEEAREKLEDYRRYVSSEAALAHAAASMGIDFSRYDIDEPIDTQKSQAIVSNVEAMTRTAGPQWTRRKLLEQMVLGSRQTPWVGSAESIADLMMAWVDETGIGGFNLSRTVAPECFDDVVDLLIPILQERGAYKTAYRDGTFREKLFGHARLPQSHPAAEFRGGFEQNA